MPRHYARDVNVRSFRVYFDGVKTMPVDFDGTVFARKPTVTITLEDASSATPYKATVTTTQCTVKFQNPYTGWVSIQVME